MTCTYVVLPTRDPATVIFPTERNSNRSCQFSADELTYTWGDKDYCIWHLPEAAKREWNDSQREDFQKRLTQSIEELGSAGSNQFNMAGVTFPKGTTGFAAKQLPKIDFSRATFLGFVSFSRTQFLGPAIFESAVFENVAFDHTTFDEDAEFIESQFVYGVTFERVEFKKRVDFQGSEFKVNAIPNFKYAAFKGDAQFFDSEMDSPNFEGASFEQRAYFACSYLYGSWATFQGVRFNGSTTFESTRFTNASFSGATFRHEARFDGSADAKADCYIGESRWRGARFESDVSFLNREFRASADFSGATFSVAPIFHGSKLHQSMIFPAEQYFEDILSEHAAGAYRTLKLGMASFKARHEEGMFFTLEQRSLQRAAIGPVVEDIKRRFRKVLRVDAKLPDDLRSYIATQRFGTRRSAIDGVPQVAPMTIPDALLSWLYDKVADFGRSAWRPLGILIVLQVLFGTIFVCIASPPFSPKWPINWGLIFGGIKFSAEQVVRPFLVWGVPSRQLFKDGAGGLVLALSTLDSIASLALVGLSLLGLNWRFKRD